MKWAEPAGTKLRRVYRDGKFAGIRKVISIQTGHPVCFRQGGPYLDTTLSLVRNTLTVADVKRSVGILKKERTRGPILLQVMPLSLMACWIELKKLPTGKQYKKWLKGKQRDEKSA